MACRILGDDLGACLRRLDPAAQQLHESERTRSGRIRSSGLQTRVERAPRGRPQTYTRASRGAHTAREVAVLKGSAGLRDGTVSVQAACDGAPDEAAVHSAHEQALEEAQPQEALVQAPKAAREGGQRGGLAAPGTARGVRIAPTESAAQPLAARRRPRVARPRASFHRRPHVVAQSRTERVQGRRIVELHDGAQLPGGTNARTCVPPRRPPRFWPSAAASQPTSPLLREAGAALAVAVRHAAAGAATAACARPSPRLRKRMLCRRRRPPAEQAACARHAAQFQPLVKNTGGATRRERPPSPASRGKASGDGDCTKCESGAGRWQGEGLRGMGAARGWRNAGGGGCRQAWACVAAGRETARRDGGRASRRHHSRTAKSWRATHNR